MKHSTLYGDGVAVNIKKLIQHHYSEENATLTAVQPRAIRGTKL